uniref:SpaJ n=1 Tax=Spirochaeta aurantia TaxID=147 RepID=Q0PHZ8_SPIAU|nr:SpaJ [Spirochaeta aurantia]
MRSSISSSSHAFLWVAGVVFIGLFVSFNLFLVLCSPTYGLITRNPALSRLQQYFLAGPAVREDTVVVGSSLPAMLSERGLGPHVRNLSFPGHSSIVGIDLLRRASYVPKRLLIEAFVVRDPAEFQDANVLDPASLFLAGAVPSSQPNQMPVSLVIGGIQEAAGMRKEPVFRGYPAGQIPEVPETSAEQKENLHRWIASAVPILQWFESQGTELVFFTMPHHPEYPTVVDRVAVAEYQATFPPDRYLWIPNLPGDYEWTDGLHMTRASGEEYAKRIRLFVDRADKSM